MEQKADHVARSRDSYHEKVWFEMVQRKKNNTMKKREKKNAT